MATFPDYNPQYSATKRSQPQQRITQFGDGYQQRTSFGLNQDSKIWNLTFNVDDEDATEIETFLEARGKMVHHLIGLLLIQLQLLNGYAKVSPKKYLKLTETE